MHGNPLFRVIALTLVLAMAGVIVSAVARSPKPASPPAPEDASIPGLLGDEAIPLQLTIQLSAPATSVSLRTADTSTDLIPPHRPDGLSIEKRSAITISDGAATALLSVTWESPSENHFVRIVAEPDFHESKELILHAPVNLENHAITFVWPDLEEDTP